MKIRALLLTLTLTAATAHAQDTPAPAAASHFTSGVEHVSLETIDSTKAIIDLTLSATADRDLDITDIRISRLRLNGMPAFAGAITGPIHLAANQKWISPTPLALTIYFRDLHSTDPLVSAVKSRAIQVDGEVMVGLQVGLLARMSLSSSRPVVPVKLSQQIAVDLPGGELGRQSLLLLLSAGDFVVQQANTAADNFVTPAAASALETENLPRIVSITTAYAFSDAAGKRIDFTWRGMGIATSPTSVVTVAEALEPWLFDPDLALEMKHGTYKLVPGTAIKLTTGNGDTLEVNTTAPVKPKGSLRKETVIIPGGGLIPTKADVAVRGDVHNLALLPIKAHGAQQPLTVSTSVASTPISAAVFRQRTEGKPEMLLIKQTSDTSHITLNDVVDSNAIGSPLIAHDGILGLVQDEATAIPWSDVERELGLKPRP